MNIEEYTNKIREKLGEDNSAKIADDIANMLTYDSKMKKDIKDRDEEITRLKKDKEMFLSKERILYFFKSIPSKLYS